MISSNVENPQRNKLVKGFSSMFCWVGYFVQFDVLSGSMFCPLRCFSFFFCSQNSTPFKNSNSSKSFSLFLPRRDYSFRAYTCSSNLMVTLSGLVVVYILDITRLVHRVISLHSSRELHIASKEPSCTAY